MTDQLIRSFYVGLYLACALGYGPEGGPHHGDPPVGEDAKNAVELWALLTGGIMTRERLQQHEGDDPVFPPAATAAALAMAERPVAQVRAELAPVWERLRAGSLPVSELPGQRP